MKLNGVGGPRNHKILSYMDHSDPRMARVKGLQFEGQERDFKDRSDISAVGRVLKDGDVTPKQEKTLMVIGGVFAVGLAAASLFIPAGGLFLTVPLAGYFAKSTYSEAKASLQQSKFEKSNLNFSGSKTWEIGKEDKKTAFIDSPLLMEDPTAEPSSKDFGQFVDKHYDAEKNNIVVVHGHGSGGVNGQVGSVPSRGISRALTKKFKETGVKTGLVVLDSCQMGSINVLNMFKDATDYLVASTADIDIAVTSDPNKSFNPFPLLAQPARSNQELANKVVQNSQPISTLAAYDMKEVAPLMEEMDKFGTALVENNDHRHVKSALKAALAETKISTQSQSTPRMIDLGAFCKQVGKHCKDPESKKQAKNVLQLLEKVVTNGKTSGKFLQTSHVSFDNPDKMNHRDRKAMRTGGLPFGWQSFLSAMMTQKPR